MLCVTLTLDLKALIRQVYEGVFRLEIVICRACPQVSGLVVIDSEVIRDDGPHTQVKLAALKEKRMLDVLLNDPALRLGILREDELIDISQVSEQFNATALVQRGRLDEPHVLLAVLDGHALLVRAAPRDLLIPRHEQVDLIVVTHF